MQTRPSPGRHDADAPPVCVLHVTDLHVGAHDGDRGGIEEAVRRLAHERRPVAVLATGDLTHRNRRAQHESAAAFLRSLGPPVLAIPGNHDLPALPPRRLLAPFGSFLREWPDLEPTFHAPGIVVCALNSVRPWKYQRGGVSRAQRERVSRVFAEAPADSLRLVALHHHLASPPWRQGKRPVPRRSELAAALAAAGAELVVCGHVHQTLVVERREFASEAPPGLVLATAPGLGRPRPSRHAEACGVNLYEATPSALVVRSLLWGGSGLVEVATRCFARA